MVKSVSGKKKNMRSFTIVYALNKKGCATKFHNKYYTGRYISRDPASSAKKAVNQLCRVKRIKGECVIYVHLKETTHNSNNKLYKYRIKRKKLQEPGPFGNEYEMIAKSLNTQTNRVKPPYCDNAKKSSGRKVSRTRKRKSYLL